MKLILANISFTIDISADPKVVLQYAGAKGRVHFYHVNCTGNETNLLECKNDVSGFAGPGSWYGRDIGVSCGESIEIEKRLTVKPHYYEHCLSKYLLMRNHFKIFGIVDDQLYNSCFLSHYRRTELQTRL